MIHVDRLPVPAVLDGDDSKGGRETARWMAFFQKKRKKKPGRFSAYNDNEVQLVLRRMFHNKCAYCEREIPVGDVEHFRPKNAVIRKDGTRLPEGYWWLAADWNNLLWSCVSCNQKRKIELEEGGDLITAGKGASFPIANVVAVCQPGDERQETPLLLNPVSDFPEQHMHVNTDENSLDKGCVQALQLGTGAIDPRAETTINLLGLNNIVTVKQRQDLLDEIRASMRRIVKYNAKLRALPSGEERDELETERKEELAGLQTHLELDQPYLMLARQVILPFLRKQQMDQIKELVVRLNELEAGSEREQLKAAIKDELKKLKAHLAPGQPHLEAARQDILPFMEQLVGGN